MNKKLNRELMGYAEDILQSDDCPLYKDKKEKIIHESYDGQSSALGVSTLMIGLRATLAVYFQDKPKETKKAYRRNLLEVIVRMMNKKNGTTYADSEVFVREVMKKENDETIWKSDVINCSVALKQVIRTYKLG